MQIGTQANAATPAHRGDGGANTIEVRDVYKSFGQFDVLNGLTLNFASNAITTILGPSGTGKSVLLKHIVGLLEPDFGEISVFGEDIWALSDHDRSALRRKHFGILFQDGALFGSMNIYDNVAFPLRRNTTLTEAQIRDVVMSRLEEVGLAGSVSKLPSEISGGMKKRAGFARALVMDPDIVLFDEPDSGLDPVRTSLLCELINSVHEQRRGTYVVVTHDLNTTRTVSDYIGVLWKGKLLHYGPAAATFESTDPFVTQFLSGSPHGPLGMD